MLFLGPKPLWILPHRGKVAILPMHVTSSVNAVRSANDRDLQSIPWPIKCVSGHHTFEYPHSFFYCSTTGIVRMETIDPQNPPAIISPGLSFLFFFFSFFF